MMRLGGIPFFISCSIIALTGKRQRNGSVKGGGGLKSSTQGLGMCTQDPQHIGERQVPEVPGTERTRLQPGRRWAEITGEQKGRKAFAPVPEGERRPGAQHFPLPKASYCFLQLS